MSSSTKRMESFISENHSLQLERLVDDPEIRKAAAKSLKGFCLTYLPHHFPLDPSDFFDDMCRALEDHVLKRVEMIGFRGCAKRQPLTAKLLTPDGFKMLGDLHVGDFVIG